MRIEISDSAVEAAMQATLSVSGESWRDNVAAEDQKEVLHDMRAALAAALPLIVGEPVGYQDRLASVATGEVLRDWGQTSKESYDLTRGESTQGTSFRVEYRPLYAIKQGASRE